MTAEISRMSAIFSAEMKSFGEFSPPFHFAVAVSGGADSMALTLLAHEWASAMGGKITALTVDHRLREESTAEALQVESWLETRGIEHHVLAWEHEADNSGNLQAQAKHATACLLIGARRIMCKTCCWRITSTIRRKPSCCDWNAGVELTGFPACRHLPNA